MKHVYFWTLPIGTRFVHQMEAYEKLEDEYALDQNGDRVVFEPHYGCVITDAQFSKFGLDTSAIRQD